MRAKKSRHRETETEQRNDTVNQRINYSIAKKVTVDLLGHREMRACRASMPVVAPSRVPVHLNAQKGGFTPPNLLALSSFSSQDSGDFRRHFVFDPARIFCVAGYCCCIGAGPGASTRTHGV